MPIKSGPLSDLINRTILTQWSGQNRRRQAERVRAAILAASIDLDGNGKCGRHDSATKSMAG